MMLHPIHLPVCERNMDNSKRRMDQKRSIWNVNYRKIVRIPYTAQMTNKRAQELAKKTRFLKLEIKQRKIRYFGRIIKADKLPKALLTGKVEEGKRRRGRPRRRWAYDTEQWTQKSMENCTRGLKQRTEVVTTHW